MSRPLVGDKFDDIDGGILMSQSVRQSARRAALEVQTRRRRERADSERRWSALGVDVAVALTPSAANGAQNPHAHVVALFELPTQHAAPTASPS